MGVEHLEISPDQLTPECNPDDLGFETTIEVTPLQGTIGQERAISALELALDIDAPGFNLFISGLPGTGRNTALQSHIEVIAAQKPTPWDWGYVHNFQEPSQPIAISLPCGTIRALARDMTDLVDTCRNEIPGIFDSDDYTHRIEDVMKEIQDKRQALTGEMEREAQKEGFALTSTQIGITPVPLIEGRPMTQEEFANLPDEAQVEFRQRAEGIQHSTNHMLQEVRKLNKEAIDRTKQVDTELVRFTLTPIIDELQTRYANYRDVVKYLDDVEADMVEHLNVFKAREEPAGPIPGIPPIPSDEDAFLRYRVNDLVDNATCVGAPVVFEYSPTYYNLFGRIDYRARIGTLTTDLTMIEAGALHKANGGYLVLQARDFLSSPLAWETLKRSLRSGQVRIENIGEQLSPLPSSTLRPHPIPIDSKIILVGSPDILRLLQVADEDFGRYFKVVADFDTVMDRTPENLSKYASFVAAQCRDNGFRSFHKTAVARIIDYSSRLVEDQDKLMTRFMNVSDMITEANYWAGKDGSLTVSGEHVKKAIEQRRYRASLTEDRMREFVEKGTIHIATDGEKTGQVNGLAVYSLGGHAFGNASRITARVSLGRGQVTNIERETQLSGKIHNKGFLILSGYLHGKYGQDKPLSLSASIGFEQSYVEIDGDSASSTELYCLLSELSGLPIDQGIAVTGSVDQAGVVQAIGGATFKIEGFFDICRVKGLTGRQGVMIPKDNLRNLALKEDVVEAVRSGQFHIYAVSTIDEGLEVLTGVPAGERQEDGTYSEGTVHHLVEKHLGEMAQRVREFGRSSYREEENENEGLGEHNV